MKTAVHYPDLTDAHEVIQARGITLAATHLVPVRYFPNGVDPQAYCCKLSGDCLEPEAYADDLAVVAPSLGLLTNTFCILWLKGADPLIKRYIGRMGSCHLVEMLNPRQVFQVHRDRLDAIHPVVHIARPDEYLSWPQAVPAAPSRALASKGGER